MRKTTITKILLLFALALGGCVPTLKNMQTGDFTAPDKFQNGLETDTTNVSFQTWKDYFQDEYLAEIIQEALANNQELKIFWQEIEMSNNEIRARKGEYLPFLGFGAGAGVDKLSQYSRMGTVEERLIPATDKPFPKPYSDFVLGASLSWEVDIWKKLRNQKKAAVIKYLSTLEARKLLVTNLVAEIASLYYELQALDNLLIIVRQNIEIQSNVFEIIKKEKDNAKVTLLAVNRFEAQLLRTQNLQYDINQRINAIENQINFLAGRFPQSIKRKSDEFFSAKFDYLKVGFPVQLLQNRPDIRQAELELQAAKVELQASKANFYPSLRISANAGTQAFGASYLFHPSAALYSILADAFVPLVNRNAITAAYLNADAKQKQALIRYEQRTLNAFFEVQSQIIKGENFVKSFETKQKEVDILSNSVEIANSLYRSARADYMEILLTQREMLDEKIELVEIRTKVLMTKVNLYRALGGGWR